MQMMLPNDKQAMAHKPYPPQSPIHRYDISFPPYFLSLLNSTLLIGAKVRRKIGTRKKNTIKYEVGEGIEKKADNFVEEVMSQVK